MPDLQNSDMRHIL